MNTADQKYEIQRLIRNQKVLLDATPKMVLIINGKQSIEYMNPSATRFFDNLAGRTKSNGGTPPELVHEFLLTIHSTLQADSPDLPPYHVYFVSHHLEYVITSFEGYKGDSLQWLIIRDITNQKKYEEELAQFHTNIETILSQKISRLKESERIRDELSEQLIHLKAQFSNVLTDDAMVGSSRPMQELREMVSMVAKSDATVLITGESGTGKELVANMIRETSNRNNKAFLKINCNTINDSLLESDLFGHEKGAFTGAATRTKGKFEVVDGGTIFLDEIGDISPRMQAALLRVLQDGEIIRVGGNSPIKIDVRVVAATNRDLALAVQDGSFRLDLFYRLNIINISIPPLRERKEDIEDLVSHFVRRYRQTFKKDVNFVPRPIIDKLLRHDWPGNVRELENVIQRAVLMTKSNIITGQDVFYDHSLEVESNNNHLSLAKQLVDAPLKNILAEVERQILVDSLAKARGNVAQAASVLQVGKTAFYDKLKRYGISSKDHR